MMNGEHAGVVRVGDVAPIGTWGVGALADLAGEVTIANGEIWTSIPGSSAPITEHGPNSDAEAALLVTSKVERWREIPVTKAIAWNDLDRWVHKSAERDGPFPFRIDGAVSNLHWHVIDGSKLPSGPSSHEAHKKAAQTGILTSGNATLVGFWSNSHRGVFTHHDRDTHVHAILASPAVTGHVDEVTLEAGSILRVPIW